MTGRIDHTIVSVNKYEAACHFYDWLMPKLGYGGGPHDYGEMRGWNAQPGSFWIKKASSHFATDTFDKDRVGLCEIAFGGENRAQIDALAQEIEAHGGKILDAPREYDYVPGYYAVFFTDPDGLKLEVVHIPQ
jgi:catechol 2,3-dioxygenase-like lactoylglutathione lyase family enzyme